VGGGGRGVRGPGGGGWGGVNGAPLWKDVVSPIAVAACNDVEQLVDTIELAL